MEVNTVFWKVTFLKCYFRLQDQKNEIFVHFMTVYSLLQTDKKSQDPKEKPAIEENAFEALERDFQEVN